VNNTNYESPCYAIFSFFFRLQNLIEFTDGETFQVGYNLL